MTTVVTELVVDARGSKQGTAEYISAMNAAQAAVDRTLDRERTLQTAMNTGGAVMQSSATSVQRTAREFDRLKASIDPAFHSARALERDILTLDRAVTRLGVSESEAARMLEAVRLKHDAVAAAAKRQTEEYLKLAAAGRAAYAADQSQLQVNQQLGVVDFQPGAARASASVFEEDARATEQMAAAAQRLRAELDPLGAAQERYNAKLAEYDAMARQGLISAQQLAEAQSRAQASHQSEIASLRQMSPAARAAASGVGSLTASMRDAAAQAGLLNHPLGNMVQRMTAVDATSSGMAMRLGAAALGLAVVAGGLAKAASAGEDFARSGRRIDAVLRTTGGAVGLVSEDIRVFTRELEASTLATQAQADAAAAKLLTFPSIQGQNFKDALTAAQDLAAVGYGSIESNVEQLGRALENPIQGLDALTRAGFRFSASQREVLRHLMETGRVAEAQKVILAEISSVVGGAGAAEAGGLSGRFAALSSAIGDFWLALDDRTSAGSRFADFLDRLARGVGRLNNTISPERFADPSDELADLMGQLQAKQDRLDALRRGPLGDGPIVADAIDIRLLEADIAELEQRLNRVNERVLERERQRSDARRTADEARIAADQDRIATAVAKRRTDLDAILGLARLDLDLAGRSLAETERRRMEEGLIAEIRKRAGEDGVAASTEEIELIKQKSAEYGRLRALQAARDIISGQGDELEAMRLEIDLIGGSSLARDRAIAALRTEQEIRRLGISLYGQEAKELRENTAALSAYAEALARATLLDDLRFEREQIGRSPTERQVASRLRNAGLEVDLNSSTAAAIRFQIELERIRDTWEEIQGVGMDAIDRIVDSGLNGFRDLGDVAKQIGADILREFAALAIKNPLKNMIYGAELPTLEGIGGLGGFFSSLLGGKAPAVPGMQNVASMQVQAAVVNLNGGIGGLGGEVTRLLNPANSNAPGQVTRAPLPDIAAAVGRNPLLDLIARAEGTAGPNGYNTSLGYGRFTGGERNLTGMTLDQIDQLQRQMLAHPGNTFNSSALGRYQIVGRTLRGLRGEMGLRGDELFDERMQDRLAMQLANRRGPNVAGLRNEWEGLRNVSGDRILDSWRQTQSAMQDFATRTTQTAVNLGDLGANALDATGGLGDLASNLTGLMSNVGGAGGGGGLFGWLFSLLGFEKGGAFSGGKVVPFVNGGIVNRPTIFPMANGGVGVMSEFGQEEAIMPVGRDSRGRLGVHVGGAAGGRQGAPQPVVLKQDLNIIDRAGVNFRQEEEDDGAGGKRAVLIIEERMAAGVSRRGSSMRGALQSEFGLRPKRRRFG